VLASIFVESMDRSESRRTRLLSAMLDLTVSAPCIRDIRYDRASQTKGKALYKSTTELIYNIN
jgi:hypothetical protein